MRVKGRARGVLCGVLSGGWWREACAVKASHLVGEVLIRLDEGRARRDALYDAVARRDRRVVLSGARRGGRVGRGGVGGVVWGRRDRW
eukprot:5292569-Prymnesium_polylepis.1